MPLEVRARALYRGHLIRRFLRARVNLIISLSRVPLNKSEIPSFGN